MVDFAHHHYLLLHLYSPLTFLQELDMILDRSNIFPSYQPSSGDDYMAGPKAKQSSSSSSSSKQQQRSSPRHTTSPSSSSSTSPLKKIAKKSPPSKQSAQKTAPQKTSSPVGKKTTGGEKVAVGKKAKASTEEAPPLIPLEGQVTRYLRS